MALTTKLLASISYKLTGSPDIGNALSEFAGFNAVELPSGTGAGKADVVFADKRTLAASASEELDLSGTLANALGGDAVFAKVKAILVKAAAGNTNNVVVGGAAENAFVGPFDAADNTVAIPPGGDLMLTAPSAGWAVTAGTADLLKIANSSSGTGVDYTILLIGTSA